MKTPSKTSQATPPSLHKGACAPVCVCVCVLGRVAGPANVWHALRHFYMATWLHAYMPTCLHVYMPAHICQGHARNLRRALTVTMVVGSAVSIVRNRESFSDSGGSVRAPPSQLPPDDGPARRRSAHSYIHEAGTPTCIAHDTHCGKCQLAAGMDASTLCHPLVIGKSTITPHPPSPRFTSA